MDAYRAIVTKRDTRHFLPNPVPADILTRILQAGRMAGSSKNTQPVRMVVVQDAERRAQLASCGDYAAHLTAAPVAIAVVLLPGGGPFDAGRAAQNLMVAAWASGITSCPVSMHRQECARTVLGLPPDHTVATVIALGYPDLKHPLSQGRQRLPLDEIVSWEAWGNHRPQGD
ncbi:nitroreductase family protein [Tepidiforma sp.]|uniref:nitroreductase family protein n=1 Tax=Tepidiforma sp. TaxID=2682230 RepID=UPI002ADE5E41|nr:nitroreductase family protein [Tepidiforma sp.]